MNWSQIHNTLTHEERTEVATLILKAIEARQQRLVFSRGRLVREKRGNFPGAHFINDRRRLRRRLPSILTRVTFYFILLTIFSASWLFVVNAPPQFTAPILLMHLVGLTAVLTIKPHRSKTYLARS